MKSEETGMALTICKAVEEAQMMSCNARWLHLEGVRQEEVSLLGGTVYVSSALPWHCPQCDCDLARADVNQGKI